MVKKIKRQGVIYWGLMGVLLMSFSAALILLILLASRMRLSGDDYCYNAVLAQEGFWGMQIRSYFDISMYNGNRYALTFFSGLTGLFPVWGSGLLSTLALLFWLLGLSMLISWGVKKLHLDLSLLEIGLFSGIYACLVLWSAPSLDQSFFWRSGMLPYFMPLMGGTWLVLFVVRAAESTRRKWVQLSLVFLWAVIVGGFSETGAALQGGFWGIIFLVCVVGCLRGDKILGNYVLPAGVVLLGTALAAAFLYLSPSTALRRVDMVAPLGWNSLVSLLALNVKVYLWIALMRQTLTVVLPVLFGIGLASILQLLHPIEDLLKLSKFRWQQILLIILLVGVSLPILVACVMLPVAYVQADYPPGRALILSQSVLTGGLILVGVLLVVLIHSVLNTCRIQQFKFRSLYVFFSLILILSVIVAPIMLFRSEVNDWQFFSKWSRLWDERHEELVSAGQRGEDEVHVIQLDHVITDVGELAPDPDYWYNNCAEMYYGIDKIVADQPGW